VLGVDGDRVWCAVRADADDLAAVGTHSRSCVATISNWGDTLGSATVRVAKTNVATTVNAIRFFFITEQYDRVLAQSAGFRAELELESEGAEGRGRTPLLGEGGEQGRVMRLLLLALAQPVRRREHGDDR